MPLNAEMVDGIYVIHMMLAMAKKFVLKNPSHVFNWVIGLHAFESKNAKHSNF